MKDRFSGYAPQYAAFRPHYPNELYDFIFRHVVSFNLAWDAGTGNGQAASVLATRFTRVLATDISVEQLEQAVVKDNISYEVAGETTKLPDRSADLVTVAQAIHWFDRPEFYHEVSRVAKPGAVIAMWVYGLLKISPEIDPMIGHFYAKVLGPYWDPERRLIDEELRTMEFPFEEIKVPSFSMKYEWTRDELEGYLNTWSATQNYIRRHGSSPLPVLMEEIVASTQKNMDVEFPLFLRAGIIL